ncbi:H+transporting two-sector ATPase B/B' subunit [Caldicellulosiruptor obsidiansis OB47]|uniref:H+transporting two-sector ATPase B/B' subunit n=1 Tax=Caldicellulosiruptor obsidiansis (strain ATCC BAA-2073 / JCM 16842 / OB47) TaxID=608506 RepID=D9TG99_CALOO|nr:FliH/SctL family protein [Caldicellulosiruptor obsidiansis]ADL43219.1 H+transporting two-sector ATPase B/B' subunit [Caldicellulosiruptor obsidiansis OB47]
MSNVIRNNQVLIQNPVETNYKVLLEKLIKARAEIENYERKLKEQEEEFEKQKNRAEAFQKEAEELLSKAKQEAQRIIDEANTRAQLILKQAQENGYKEGFEKGLLDAQKEYKKMLENIEIQKAMILKERENILKDLENEVLLLVPQILEKVLEREIRDKSFLQQYIKNAILQLSIRNSLTLRVSEEDFEYVNEKLEEILRGIDGVDKVDIKVDKALRGGDVVIETPYGFVETGVRMRLEKIQEIIESLIGD